MGIKVIKKVAPAAEAKVTTAPVQKIVKPAADTSIKKEAEAPPQTTHAASAVAVVTKEYKDGSVVEDIEDLGTVKSSEPMASVHISMGLTRNLGNYESVKVSVGVTLPCLPTAEDIEETYVQGKGWIDDKINAINEEVSGQISS